ncbi:hypothetical protein KY285_023554 [Solanum tuberosum]|nr:hypothetical protein KY289_023888 [Solanum tuberosum]KAH0675753.1 hypothetical protein KY285_023554 [Solanum tuberosum]
MDKYKRKSVVKGKRQAIHEEDIATMNEFNPLMDNTLQQAIQQAFDKADRGQHSEGKSPIHQTIPYEGCNMECKGIQ